MVYQGATKAPIKAFVNQDSHLIVRLDSFQHLEFPGLDYGNCLLASHGRKCFKEIFHRFAALKRIDEVLERHASTHEHRCSTHDFGIRVNNSFQFFRFHLRGIYHSLVKRSLERLE